MKFDRGVYFDMVRGSLFNGKLTQQQVDGQNGILDAWEKYVPEHVDLRYLAYMLATTLHETASTMWPIAENGKGAGMEYGKPAGPYNQIYYGRGDVQLTWWDNYKRADAEMNKQFNAGWVGDKSCEKNADLQLRPEYAAPTMYLGMTQGWFRSSGGSPETLSRYFNDTKDDAYGAREIINGDKSKVPSWSNGVSIGNLIKGYHGKFLAAIHESVTEVGPEPLPPPVEDLVVTVTVPRGVRVEVKEI
jgi:hypothetical protein